MLGRRASFMVIASTCAAIILYSCGDHSSTGSGGTGGAVAGGAGGPSTADGAAGSSGSSDASGAGGSGASSCANNGNCPTGFRCCYPCGIPGCTDQCIFTDGGQCPLYP